tara:strand:- start:2020 stop:2421 length:402 start_codon:yes stop_codon:yes gene_type:complete
MQQYITHNDMDIDANGTHRMGSITAGYSLLCSLFGQPYSGDDYKSDAMWDIEFEDGTVATIYNWKNGMNYCGAEGIPTVQISKWNIGGNEQRALDLVREMIENAHRITVTQGHVHGDPQDEEDILWQQTILNR